MKKILSIVLVLALCVCMCFSLSACSDKVDYTVGICQLMEHESLDKATNGFTDALNEVMQAEGKTIEFDTQVAGDANLCTTVINTFTAKKVDLIMANATPALLAAAHPPANPHPLPAVIRRITAYPIAPPEG